MAQIHPGDFLGVHGVALSSLCVFAVLFWLTAFMKSRKMSLVDLVLFAIFGILGFIDFYH